MFRSLSFLCKDREEKYQYIFYNDKDKYMTIEHERMRRFPMEWIERLNQSMNYIEEHLTGEIEYEQLGRIACCSAYHYQVTLRCQEQNGTVPNAFGAFPVSGRVYPKEENVFSGS